jgi:hypothetical protein
VCCVARFSPGLLPDNSKPTRWSHTHQHWQDWILQLNRVAAAAAAALQECSAWPPCSAAGKPARTPRSVAVPLSPVRLDPDALLLLHRSCTGGMANICEAAAYQGPVTRGCCLPPAVAPGDPTSGHDTCDATANRGGTSSSTLPGRSARASQRESARAQRPSSLPLPLPPLGAPVLLHACVTRLLPTNSQCSHTRQPNTMDMALFAATANRGGTSSSTLPVC